MTSRTSTPPLLAPDDFFQEHDRPCLARRIEDRLRRSGYLALREVACDTRGGVVRLRGCLPSYYLKQIAQATVSEVEGVRQIINRIKVESNSDPSIGFDPAKRALKRSSRAMSLDRS
jgi:osmotically-inducible protein OsmY